MTRRTVARRCAVVIAPAALALALASCATGSGAPTARTDTVSRADITAGVSASGSLSAVGTQNLGFAASGKLTSVRVHVGDHVKAGQVLATVDATAAKAALAQAKGNLHAQQAGLSRLTSATTVSGAQSTADQADTIVAATKGQVTATADADSAAISRAKTQLNADQDAKDDASSALKKLEAACKAAQSSAGASAALIQKAQQQLTAGDSAGAAATLAQLNAGAGSGDTSACAGVAAAQSAVAAAKAKVVGDQTALVAAQQKKKVDAAAGKLSVASAQQAAIAAQNGLDSTSADRPHSIDQQQALVDSAEAAVRSAQKVVDDTTLRAPSDGTIEVVNGAKGEYVAPSTGTTAQAPGSAAAIPGSTAATSATGASRPGGTQFMVLSNVKKLQLVLPFEQSDAAQVLPNQKVSVLVDAVPDAVLDGHVVSIAPSSTANAGAISYYVTVAMDQTDSKLRDGQTARGTVHTLEKDDVLSVPNAAVHRQGSTTTVVLLASDGSQQTAPFEAGVVGSDRTEVLSGLNEGQRVVLPSGAS
jgi:HlyD family secretion protein